jgi:hypothetical protein
MENDLRGRVVLQVLIVTKDGTVDSMPHDLMVII